MVGLMGGGGGSDMVGINRGRSGMVGINRGRSGMVGINRGEIRHGGH